MIDDFTSRPHGDRAEPPKPRISYDEDGDKDITLPEPVAAPAELAEPSESDQPTEPDDELEDLKQPEKPEKPDHPKKRFQWRWHWPPTKRELIVNSTIVLLVAACGVAYWTHTHTNVKVVQNTGK